MTPAFQQNQRMHWYASGCLQSNTRFTYVNRQCQASVDMLNYQVCLVCVQRKAFRITDEAFYRAVHRVDHPEKDAGSTALAVLLVGPTLLVANAGDSRAVLSRRGKAIDLSRDHKPSCPSERERIRTAGTDMFGCPCHISAEMDMHGVCMCVCSLLAW
jgi:serine/threonine protein phosphatase PrpC